MLAIVADRLELANYYLRRIPLQKGASPGQQPKGLPRPGQDTGAVRHGGKRRKPMTAAEYDQWSKRKWVRAGPTEHVR